MSDNSKHYDYYRVDGKEAEDLYENYEQIQQERQKVIQGAMDSVGAVAYIPSSGWGDKGTKIWYFVWDSEFEFPCQITIKRKEMLDGKPVICARGKGNTKDGRAYNKVLDSVMKEANTKLENLPSWQDYLIGHYNVMRTGFGEPAGRGFGVAMLSTYCGMVEDKEKESKTLVFAIPKLNDESGERQEQITIPESFQKITYGAFYDLCHKNEE